MPFKTEQYPQNKDLSSDAASSNLDSCLLFPDSTNSIPWNPHATPMKTGKVPNLRQLRLTRLLQKRCSFPNGLRTRPTDVGE